MLNIIFSVMIILSIVFSFIGGGYEKVIEGALSSAGDTIELMFTILSSMCLFNGIIRVAEKSGLTDKISAFLKKPLKLIFRDVNDDRIFGVMSMNVCANLLGMGNAATPLGIKAMEMLHKMSRKAYASNSMCLFAIINTASIQLIPTTILAVRMKYDSQAPFIIVVPIWICSMCGLLAGIISAKICERKKQ